MGVDEVGLCQIHRVGGHFGRRLLLDAVDGLDAADQDAIQPVIVQVVTVPRQLVLVDEGIERVSGKLVQLARQRDRRKVAVHMRHVEAIGGPAVVGGKVDQIPELVMLKVKCGKGQMAVLAAGGDLLPHRVGQQGLILVAEAVVVIVRPAVEQLRPLATALRHGADCQHQGGRDTVIPKAQHQPAANGSQQHTCQPRQPRAGGKHCPEVHQKLRDGHGEQRFSVHRDGVSARGNQIQHQHHSAGNEPVAVGGKEFFRLAGVADYAEHRQHHGQRCSDACINILLPALRQPRHKQAEIVRAA